MILWNRDRPYHTKLTSAERRAIAKAIATPETIKFANRLNIVINTIALSAALIAFEYAKFNLVVFAALFILTDACLLLTDHLVFIVIPHWKTMHCSLKSAQKRLDRVVQKRDDVTDAISQYEQEHRYAYRDKDYQILLDRKAVMNRFIHDEEKWIDSELEKIKEQEIKTEKRQSKDYTDKKEYLDDIREKLDYYVHKQSVVILLPVLESVDLLLDTVSKKPIGYGLISSTLYIYLDELSSIVDKLIALDKGQQEEYVKDVTDIAIALSDNINTLIERIKNLETEDIEVGIAVLLRELTRKEEPNFCSAMTNDRKEESNNV
jgi:hypothetical protein